MEIGHATPSSEEATKSNPLNRLCRRFALTDRRFDVSDHSCFSRDETSHFIMPCFINLAAMHRMGRRHLCQADGLEVNRGKKSSKQGTHVSLSKVQAR